MAHRVENLSTDPTTVEFPMNRPMQRTFLNYSVTGQMQIVKFVTKIVTGLMKVGIVGKKFAKNIVKC